jgi:DNA (cytosine-5)-methyltransferase 1
MKQIRRTKRQPGEPKPSDFWRTPRALFVALHAEFGFHLDLAADTENHLVDRWLGPGGLAENALTVPWTDYGRRGFANPPYSSDLIAPFLAKFAQEAEAGFTTVALTPCTPDTRWWQLTQHASEIREIPHRVGYLKADGVKKTGAMFASAVLVFRPQLDEIRTVVAAAGSLFALAICAVVVAAVLVRGLRLVLARIEVARRRRWWRQTEARRRTDARARLWADHLDRIHADAYREHRGSRAERES